METLESNLLHIFIIPKIGLLEEKNFIIQMMRVVVRMIKQIRMMRNKVILIDLIHCKIGRK